MLHRGFPGKPHLSVGASLAARFQTKIKNVFTTEITETMEESDCFNSVISANSVVKRALLLVWEVQQAESPTRARFHRAKKSARIAPRATRVRDGIGSSNVLPIRLRAGTTQKGLTVEHRQSVHNAWPGMLNTPVPLMSVNSLSEGHHRPAQRTRTH